MDNVQLPDRPRGGSTLDVHYTARTMKCYSVTDSELRTIGLANVGQNIFLSLGSAMLAFSLDIFKDTTLATSVPTAAAEIASYVQPICLFLGIAFYIAAGSMWVWRKGMIDAIKKESSDVP